MNKFTHFLMFNDQLEAANLENRCQIGFRA
jgi:hypothetical protein